VSATPASPDPYRLDRFLDAQAGIHDVALAEIQAGRKQTHWMWFVFPQIAGLGSSRTSQYYAIKSAGEARAYLEHPVLGDRLRKCADAVLHLSARSATDVFGSPDDLKLWSSATLFAAVSEPGSAFEHIISRYFRGEPDTKTLELLATLGDAAH
jgi:uncharacterized protein (DUF1810 family)